jgi:hypothetical protein
LNLGRSYSTILDEGCDISLIGSEPVAYVLWEILRREAFGARISQDGTDAIVGGHENKSIAVGTDKKVTLREVGRGGIDDRLMQQILSDTLCHRGIHRFGASHTGKQKESYQDEFF